MSDTTMAEIAPGVWLPRRSAGVMNPEEEDDEYVAPVLAPAPAGEDGYYSARRAGAARPLEPVAAVTFAEAREKAAAAALTSLEKAFKHHPLSARDYSEAEWEEVPDITQPLRQTVFNCVKRYRFIKYSDKLIIEVELMSGTTLRHIIKPYQVKGILTKGHTRPYAEDQRPEKEVIIDLRTNTCAGYAPEQVKFKLSGEENALAFHLALMDVL
jgi:hypothetical protein